MYGVFMETKLTNRVSLWVECSGGSVWKLNFQTEGQCSGSLGK